MREQRDWGPHAEFMNSLVDTGRVLLGGPLGSGEEILLLIEADSPSDIQEILADDPWSASDPLVIDRIDVWQLLMNVFEPGDGGTDD